MNFAHANGIATDPRFTPIKFDDFAVSWAGPHPRQPGFCFGSEDGRLLFTNERFEVQIGPSRASQSGEAINGVAFSGKWMAVSTRADVTMTDMAFGEGSDVFGIPFGAHGIVATPSGYFAAPMGPSGIMMLKAGSVPGDEVGVLSPNPVGMSFFRVIALRGNADNDLLVCAMRQRGIGLTELQWGDPMYNMRVAAFDGIDVVDVCAVSSSRGVLAVAAVGRDGTLILVRDALGDADPINIKFNTIQGTAYRLLSRGDDLLLLTSRALYILEKLASRLATGIPTDRFTTHIMAIPLEAVDASVIRDRWLLVITPDEVLVGDLDLIHRAKQKEVGAETPQTLSRVWQRQHVSSNASVLAAV
jgi:hypothetical protein